MIHSWKLVSHNNGVEFILKENFNTISSYKEAKDNTRKDPELYSISHLEHCIQQNLTRENDPNAVILLNPRKCDGTMERKLFGIVNDVNSVKAT